MTIALAVCLSWIAPQAQDDPIETRVYNIESLVKSITDQPGSRLGIAGEAVVVEEEAESTTLLGSDVLVDLIKTNIAEDSWEELDTPIESTDGVLTITNRRSVHAKVAAYLAYLRGVVGRMVSIDAQYIRIDPALLSKIRPTAADRPCILAPDQVQQILEAAREGKHAELINTMRVTAHNRQRVNLRDAVHHAFIRDYDVQIATASVMLDPVPDQFSVGSALDIRPLIDPFNNSVTLEIRATLAEAEALEERTLSLQIQLGSGSLVPGKEGDSVAPKDSVKAADREIKLHHPKVTLGIVKTSVTARERETVLAGATHVNGRMLLVLLTPSIISVDEKPAAEPTFEEQRLARFYDTSLITRMLPDFIAPRMDLESPLTVASLSGGATFTLHIESAGTRIDDDTLVAMIQRNVAPDTWSNTRNAITAVAGGILVRQKPDVLKEVERYLANLASSRAVLVTTEAFVLAFRKGARAELEKSIPALGVGGYFLEVAQFAKLLEQASTNGRIAVVDRAEVTCFSQEKVHAGRLREETYLADYEPQISTLAGAQDLTISTLRTGFLLEVRPHLIAGTDRIGIELNASLATREMKEIKDLLGGAGYLQLPRVASHRWNTSVTCARDKYTVVGIDSRRVGDEVEELVLFVRARAAK